jgi:hypothetical protein
MFALDKRRTAEGITPLEYRALLDLSARLRKQFPKHPVGRCGETLVRVEFFDLEELRSCTMFDVKPIGVYLSTPFAATVGTKFTLVAAVKKTTDESRCRVEVVSNNVGPDFSAASLGMGLKSLERDCELIRMLCHLNGIEFSD